jgi:hypothetical protein
MTNFTLGEGEEEYVEGIWFMYIVVSFVIYVSGLNMEHSLKEARVRVYDNFCRVWK